MEGGRADWLAEWTNDGTMPTLATLRDSGASGTLTSVNPPTSAVMHASLITGALPGNSGIVGERVHRPEDGFYWYTPGFDLPFGAEPMWVSAQNASKSAAVLFWPGVTPEMPSQLPDYIVSYGERIAYSQVYELSFVAGSRWAGSPVTFSPSGESSFQITSVDDVLLGIIYVLALDTTDDATPDYDTFVLSLNDRDLDASDTIITSSGDWESVVLDSAAGVGGDFLITSSDPGKITLFQSGIYRLTAAPEDFRESLTEQFNFFAPPPDYYALEHGWITSDDYMQMVRRQSDWMMDVTLWVDQTVHPDLLFTVQSPLSQTANEFLLIDERQSGYSSDRAAQYQAYLNESAAQLDRVLLRLANSPTSEPTALLLVGTTPVAPIHTQVNLNKLLADQSLLRLGRTGFVVVPASKAIAFASGGSAHVYISLAGRESAGIVQSDQFTPLQDQIVELLTGLTDPDTGEAVFAHVVRHDELAALSLDGSYAGDIFVQANEGYLLSDDRTASSVFESASYYGQSGYDPNLPEMQTALFIASPGVEPHIFSETGSIVDIASTLTKLLDLPIRAADGQPIPGILP
jgi:predicted AlkP superfamily phosphohydrolase/phosphomutase